MDEKEIIMVVEDSESLNNFIAKNLIEQGFEVIQCFNAKDAYRKLSKNFISLCNPGFKSWRRHWRNEGFTFNPAPGQNPSGYDCFFDKYRQKQG